MGSCGTKPIVKSQISAKLSVVPYQNPTNYTVKIIQPSLFYNLIAKDINREIDGQTTKNNEYIDFRDQKSFRENHIKSAMNIDVAVFKESKEDVFKSLKLLLDFKNLIIMGENLVSFVNYITEDLLEFLKLLENAKISINAIYILNGNISQYLAKFPCFSDQPKQSQEAKRFPLLIYSENDKNSGSKNGVIVPKNIKSQESMTEKNKTITSGTEVYIQEYTRFVQDFNETIYLDILGVKNVLVLSNSQSTSVTEIKQDISLDKALENSIASKEKIPNILTGDLANNKTVSLTLATLFKLKSPLIIIHEKKQAEAAMNNFLQFLETSEKIEANSLRSYIEERIPKLRVASSLDPNEIIARESEKKKSVKVSPEKSREKGDIKSRADEIDEAMQSLKKGCKKNMDTVNEIYSLITKIIDNIIKNPEDEKYRSLNGNNPKLKDTIFKYDGSKKILEIAGFRKKDGENQYANPLDANTLKHIKVDLDIGYKNIQTS